MRVLAIDTALTACAVAIYDTDIGLIAKQSHDMVRGHAEALMPMIARVMAEGRAQFDDIDRIAVTVGPGSFTGLRVGVAAARGLALAAGKPAVGVTTLAAFAAPHAGKDERVTLSAVDARNDQVYIELFGADGVALAAARIATLPEAVEAALAGPVRIVGNAAAAVAAFWLDRPPRPLAEQTAAPDIITVARLGVAASPHLAVPKPFYLRGPGARPQEPTRLLRR